MSYDEGIAVTAARAEPLTGADVYVSEVEIRVLGSVEVLVEGTPAPLGGPKQRAVLATLISDVGQVVSVDRMVDSVWGEAPPSAVRNSVHTYISNLRSVIGGNIERTGNGYRLTAEPSTVDATVFAEATDEGRSSLSANPSQAAETLRSGLSLWRGRPYADLIDVPGLQEEIRRLENLRDLAVEARIDADLAIGRHSAVVGELEALTVEHPLNEGLRVRHMLALYRDGRQADALRAYQQTREILVAELGVDPSPDLQRMEERILLHDPDLLADGESRMEEIAFLFTDLEGSTALWETRPEQMREALARHDEILSNAVTEAGGRVFKHTGDGVLAAFTTVAEAAKGAIEAQVALIRTDWGSIGPLSVRAAVDVGEVDVRGGDYFGAPMNRGARLMSSAHGGQIVLSAAAHEKLQHQAGVQIKNLGEHRFRGLGAPQQVFQLLVAGLEPDFPELRTDAAAPESGREFGDAIRGYEIRERIGVGRFGIVYRAYQPTVGREVAVKVIRPEFANHPSFVRRFESEARIVAKLEHPHIVSLFDFWRDHEGAYLVMPYLAGKSLAGAPYGAMPLDRVAEILRQVGAALSYAHRQGVIHRDVKPANLLLDADGNAYLADFGIAVRAVEQATGLLPGSQVFRAPEDRAGGSVDERSDVYSLAAVTAEMLTGMAPPDADLSTLPTDLEAVIARGMATEPADRFVSIDDFLASFILAIGDEAGPSAVRIPTRNPYKGLAAFDEIDARDFFGRDAEVATLLDLVAEDRFATVVGPSGSGKSSLVRAGLLPILRAGGLPGSANWLIVTMVPGAHPFDELATALSEVATDRMGDLAAELRSDEHGLLRISKKLMHDLDGELVVLVDQFEELYSLAGDDKTTELFIESLLEATADPHSRLRVVATIRADYFDQPLLDDRLGPVVAEANLALSVPGPEALREAIERPAEAAGVDLEAGLAMQIVADVRDEPGGLPLMQFALADLVRHAAGRVTLNDYTASGGVTGALSSRADEVYDALGEADRGVAEQIFLRLVSVSDDAGDVRRRVRRSELETLGYDAGSVDRVLDAFGSARLLTFDRDPITRGPTVEVAHEALLREWDQYRIWIDAQRASLLTRRRFEQAMQEWETADRTDDLLPTGGRLAQFEEWAAEATLAEHERTFLTTAVTRRETDRAQRRKRRQRVLMGFAAAAALAIVLAVAALVQRSSAQHEALIANAQSLTLVAEKNIDVDPELSILLALEAIDAFETASEDPVAAITVLRQAFSEHRIVARVPGGDYLWVAADGSTFATAGEGGSIAVWDAASLQQVRTIEVPNGFDEFSYVWGSPQSLELYADVRSDGEIHLRSMDLASGTWEEDLGGPIPKLVWWYEVSPDGTLLAVQDQGLLEVKDTATHTTLFELTAAPESGLAFIDDKRIAFTVLATDGTFDMNIVSAESGVELQVAHGLSFVPEFLVLSPDGDRVAFGTQLELGMVDLVAGEQMWARSDLDRVSKPLWLESQNAVLVGGEGVMKVIDATTGVVIRNVVGNRGGSWEYGSIVGSDRVVAAGIGDNQTLILDVSDHPVSELQGIQAVDEPFHLALTPSGDHLLMGGGASFNIVDVRTDSILAAESAPAGAPRNTFVFPILTRTGEFWAAAEGDGISRVRSSLDDSVVYSAPDGWAVRGVSEDAAFVVISLDHAGAKLVRTSDGEMTDLVDAGIQIFMADFMTDGSHVLVNHNPPSVSAPAYATIYSVPDGERLVRIGEDHWGLWTEFTPDGQSIIVGVIDGSVISLDVDKLLAGQSAADALNYLIPAHSNVIVPGVISIDGSMFATTAWNERVGLWDTETGESLGQFGTTARSAVAFDASGSRLYVAEIDTVLIYALEIEELKNIAQSRLTRALTAEECLLYLDRECDDNG